MVSIPEASARRVLRRSTPTQQPPRILLFTDPGPDPDDTKALLVLATLHRDGVVDFAGAVCNGGGQPASRAALARCLLDKLGMSHVPVAVGSVGTPYVAQPHEYALSGYADVDAARLVAAPELTVSAMLASEPGGLTVVLISSLRDFADVIIAHPQLARRAVGSVSVMGGLERDERARFGWVADSSVNNGFDMAGAQAVYDWCFAEGVPLVVVSRHAVPLLPMSLARSFAERSTSEVLRYLAEAQFLGLEGLWQKLREGKLPARCSKQWYFATFCGVGADEFARAGHAQLDASASIRDKLNGFVKPYDVIALMAALPHTRALIAPSTRLDARAWGQDAHVEVRADDGRVVAHLLLLAPEHAPEQRHVVALLRETYHKTAFLTQAHVSQPGAGVHIDPRLMGARAVSSLPTASPKRPSKLPMLGSMRVGPERVAPAADTSGSGRQASVHERGSPLPQCAGDGANIAQSPLPSRGGNAATAGRDRGVIVHRDVCLVSPAALAARIDLALKAARAVDERASARVFAALAILVLIAIGGVLWAVTSHAPLLRESLLLTLPTLDLALVIMTLWLRDDHTHRSTIHATLVATATAIGITLLCTLLIALASVGARTSPGFSLRVGVADRARDAARAAAAWLAVLALGAALTALAAVALRAASPARRVARLWSSIRLSTSASAVLLFTHELLCAKQRCDEVRPRAEKAVLFASASVLLAIVCPMYAPHARARMRALLLWVVRWERAEADTPLVALLGLHEARFDGRDTARSAAEVMAAAGRAFQVVDLFDLAVALRAGDAEAGSDGLLARASVWERTPPAHTAQRHLASSAACACRGARAWLLQSAERAWARTGAWLPARAPAQAQRRIARTMERLGTAVCDGTTPPTGSRSAQLGSRKRTSARLPAESAGAPLPTASHELSPVLGDGRDPSRRTREQRRISWESCTLAPHGVPGRRHAAREQALDLHQLRAARNARVHNAADAKDSVDFFVVHSHLDSAELKRAALAEWCARREDGSETIWLDVLSADGDDWLAHMPFHLARARKLLVLCGLDFARSFEAVAQLFVWVALGGSLNDVDVLLIGGPESAAGVYASFDAFHVMWVHPARCSRSQERLVRAVELASVAGFNEVVRAYLQRVPQQAPAAATHAIPCQSMSA